MLEARRPTEEDVFDLRIGLDEAQIPLDQKHWFDINGYVVLEGLLSPARIEQARAQSDRMAVARRRAAPGGQNVEQLVHIVKDGGLLRGRHGPRAGARIPAAVHLGQSVPARRLACLVKGPGAGQPTEAGR